MAEENRVFKLPDLGEGLTEAELVQWLVKEGDTVELNQPICEVETEKALVEIPSPFAGRVVKTYGDVGETIQVGKPLIEVQTTGEAPKTGRKEVLVGYGPEEEGTVSKRRRRIGKGKNAEAEPEPEPATPVRALATPPVRKLAKEMGVDIDALSGTGKDGRVTREDVIAASEGGEASAPSGVELAPAQRIVRREAEGPEEERVALRATRRSIAEKMVRSAFSIPHVAEWLDVDATEMMRLRNDLKSAHEAEGIKISPLPILVKALIAAIRPYPLVNSSWDQDTKEIVIKHRYHIGIATDTDRGLLVPVIRDADQLNVFQIASEIARLATAARDGKATVAELTGSTITITNVGSFGMTSGTPIINHPEAAILAPGVVARRPWVVDDQIVPRDVMTLSLSFDHRIIDGAYAGRFLRYLADLIEKPARLFGVL